MTRATMSAATPRSTRSVTVSSRSPSVVISMPAGLLSTLPTGKKSNSRRKPAPEFPAGNTSLRIRAPQATPTLWGLPVVATKAIAEGKFLVGAFNDAAMIFDRQQSTVEISLEHGENFIKNLATLLYEERLALAVFLGAALRYGSFPS
jgi:hypothetical protein